MREPYCPACGACDFDPLFPQGLLERYFPGPLFIHPFRCRKCNNRFRWFAVTRPDELPPESLLHRLYRGLMFTLLVVALAVFFIVWVLRTSDRPVPPPQPSGPDSLVPPPSAPPPQLPQQAP